MGESPFGTEINVIGQGSGGLVNPRVREEQKHLAREEIQPMPFKSFLYLQHYFVHIERNFKP